jgi:D-alanyl-D-alanine carboxypeptidase
MIDKTYIGKMFVVIDSQAVVRDPNDLSRSLRFKQGDSIPPGKAIGDPITIPKLSEVHITDVRTDEDRNLFVLAEPAGGPPASPFGWTRASNLKDQFVNEITGSSPGTWILFPQGNNMTVVDKNAINREGPPAFASTGGKIARGTFVVVVDSQTVPQGKFSKVSHGRLDGDQMIAEDEIGWTKTLNLADGWSAEYAGDSFADQQGPNAAWRGGEFIGQKVLVDIVGTGGQQENVTLAGLEPYRKLTDALGENENILLSIESGFRSFPRQVKLRELFEAHHGNLAAKPGFSNHQHGQAFDLNTTDKLFDDDPIYRALKKHGPPLGFIRTVSDEPWHWEFRPADAAEHGFKMPGVDP